MNIKTNYNCILTIADGITLTASHYYEEGYKYNGRPVFRLDITDGDKVITKTISQDTFLDLEYFIHDINKIISQMPEASDI